MIKIDKNIVQTITWEQDPNTFDRRLHAAGQAHDEFIVVNPKYDPWILDYIDPKEIVSDKCVVWAIDNLWLVKKFKRSWTESKGWDLVHCELDIEKSVKFNPEVKFINTSLRNSIENYKINIEDAASEHVWYTEDRVWIAKAVATEFEITGSKDMGVLSAPLVYNPALPEVDFDITIDLPYFHYDYNYELVWYIDDKFNNDGVKIWVAKFLPDASQGVKDMGYVQPVIEYNSYIPIDEFDSISAPYQDLIYEHVWYLDSGFTYLGDKIWAAKITPRNSQGYKEKGFIKPKDYAGPVMEYNPAIPQVEFDFSRRVVYHDLNYDLVWYLDPNYVEDSTKVWAVKIASVGPSKGVKDMGYVGPVIEYNKDIPDVDCVDNTAATYIDFDYELVWYLDPKFNFDNEKIWVKRITPKNSKGVKDMGYTSPLIEYNSDIPSVKFDVEFSIPYQDLIYEHVWYIDKKFNFEPAKVWYAKISPRTVHGHKDMGFVSPVLITNPALNNFNFDIRTATPYYNLDYELVWYLDNNYNPTEEKIWAAKIKPINEPQGLKDMGYVSPIVEYNQDIPRFDIEEDQSATYIDFEYELVWYLDPKFNFDNEKIWVKRIRPNKSLGVKDMGYVRPVIKYNPDIPKVAFDVDISVPYQDLIYDHVWYLDQRFNPLEDRVWAIRIAVSESQGLKTMGSVSPIIKKNPAIPDVNFVFDEVLPYYEFKNDIVWYIDPRFNPTDDSIWALRIDSLEPDPGLKDVGFAHPEFVYNPDIPRLDYFIDDHIPYYDLGYEHVWMLDDNLHTDNEKIWAARIIPNGQRLGVKEVGNIGVRFGGFDVVFISYHEPNAEANWQRVLEICPTAKRVKNVKGIFQAHKQAAALATTEMFYVVDGDAELVDNWRFDFRPNVFDMDCVHLWTSINPINDLEYGYGGVKLFPRQMLLDAETWKIDLTTGLGKLKLVNKISNVTAFNYDAFTTWRSAFRECAKLSSSLDPDAERRLEIWCTQGMDRPNGQYAIDGAKLGRQYGLDNLNNTDKLKLINDYEWMKNEFNEFYKH